MTPSAKPVLIRDCVAEDTEAVAALIDALGYPVTPAEIAGRLAELARHGQSALVAERGEIIGVLTISITRVIHRPRPVGRISMLVVAPECRGGGVGAALVAEAENRMAAAGCGLLEVTSNIRRERAHSFYEKLGYERTSYRFARPLQD